MNLPLKTTSQNYRQVEKTSYSSLKLFIKDRMKFYKEFILGEPREQEDTFAILFGSLVDCLLLDYEHLNDNFAVASSVPPSEGSQMRVFVDELYKRTLMCSTDGECSRPIEDLLQETYQAVSFDSNGKAIRFKGKDFEKVVGMFVGSDAELYYNEMRRNTGKKVISLGMMQKAEETVAMVKSNFVTRHLFEDREDVDVYQQEPIEFVYLGEELKSMIDHFEVHHKLKEIHLYDLKCTWEVENFSFNYIKNRYDIQATIYYIALEEWKKRHNLEDYIVKPMSFITVDSTGTTNPLIHRTSMRDMNKSLNGFSINGKEYMGVNQAIKELQWAKQTGIWNISKQAYDSHGIMGIQVNYD